MTDIQAQEIALAHSSIIPFTECHNSFFPDQGSIIQDSITNCKDEDHATKDIAAAHTSLLLLALLVTKGIVEQKAHQWISFTSK